jgi:hypothetical protein
MYLIYAEAVLRGGGGDKTTALQYMNAIRERAFGNASNDITDSQLTLQFILNERDASYIGRSPPHRSCALWIADYG